jgi:hypothetical protein
MSDNVNPRHPNSEVRRTLDQLVDELTTWGHTVIGKEGQTVLIFREARGFCARFVNGKSTPPADEVSDSELMSKVARELTGRPFVEHPDPRIRRYLFELVEALCRWERDSGIESFLILRGGDGHVYRAVNGNFNIPPEVPDEHLLAMIQRT